MIVVILTHDSNVDYIDIYIDIFDAGVVLCYLWVLLFVSIYR